MLDRFTLERGKKGGKACIRGLRITVSLVVNLLANGLSVEEIIGEYPDLQPEDVRQAMRFAAELVADEVFPLKAAGKSMRCLKAVELMSLRKI